MADTIAVSAHGGAHSFNMWILVAVVEFVVIVVLLARMRGGSHSLDEKMATKKRVMAEGDIDMGNIVNSAFNAQKLCKELLVKCHPDRFPDDEAMREVADDLSKRITKNKHDLKALQSLKEEAMEKLNINF